MSGPHPYQNLPDHAFWRRAVAQTRDIDPVVGAPFKITSTDAIVTAGSCFAQHIGRHLRDAGYHYLITERAHPLFDAEDAAVHNYGIYSARYGNIYTARQLLQLIDRAYGRFRPEEDCWDDENGSVVDPFRPEIQPGGFSSPTELRLDRDRHFACVRQALETLDLFVFTLGLTETWRSTKDGAVYPLCPGVRGGKFDPAKHEFQNFTVAETAADLDRCIALIRDANPKARVVLTVSPVPLVATASGQHVVTATSYSKSVLRVACEQIVSTSRDVCYFPSYEIITGSFSRGAFFAEDLRTVTEAGVAVVMSKFLMHFGEKQADTARVRPISSPDAHTAEMARLIALHCEEEALDPSKR